MNSKPNLCHLPKKILHASMNPESLESQQVIAKYSCPDALIGEESVDSVALNYMSMDAIRYWLPKFLAYLRTQAKPDSFHFDAMLMKLSNNYWAYELQANMSQAERAVVSDYLEWLGHQPHMLAVMKEVDLVKAQYVYAVELWK